jgi:transcription initiation factor TFIIIB Brf1 subunit/transcription initiation factor TFIIB
MASYIDPDIRCYHLMADPCPLCSSTRCYPDARTGEMVCSECGAVSAPPPMVGPAYVTDDEAIGHGPASWTLSQFPVTPLGVDGNRKSIPPNRKSEFWRLHREDVRSLVRQTTAGFGEVDVRMMAQTAGLPIVAATDAAKIHTRWRTGFPRQSGLRNEDCAAACILMAARVHRVSTRTETILRASGSRVPDIWRAVNRLRREVGVVDPVTLNPGAEPFIVSISAMFSIPGHIRETARLLLAKVKDFGYKPACYGAGAIFAAYERTGLRPEFSQTDVAVAVGTTDTCIRNARRIILAANSATPPVEIQIP